MAKHGADCDPIALAPLEQMIAYIARREPLLPGMHSWRRPPPGWPF